MNMTETQKRQYLLSLMRRSMWLRSRRDMLTNHNFTILSSNCIGGVIYSDWKMKFLSPTVNTIIKSADFVKLCQDVRYYIQQELMEDVSGGEQYPVGHLGDIRVHFVHSKSFEQAKAEWDRRKQRIQYGNIFVIMTYVRDMAAEDEAEFERILYPKVLFVFHPTDRPDQFYIRDYADRPKPKSLVDWQDETHQRRCYEQFDLVSFFNQKNAGRERTRSDNTPLMG